MGRSRMSDVGCRASDHIASRVGGVFDFLCPAFLARATITPMAQPTPHSRPPRVALETTLLVHGVPPESSRGLVRKLGEICRGVGAEPAIVGVVDGRAIVGMSDADLETLLSVGPAHVPKLNTGNLGPALFRKSHGATTVSATMELAARAGVSVFATGGLGGVHKGVAPLDISADLFALTRFPVAVVTSG